MLTELIRGGLDWLAEHAGMMLPTLFAPAGLVCLSFRGKGPTAAGAALCGLALVTGFFGMFAPLGLSVHSVCFYVFSGIAVASGLAMIATKNPVYAALQFALVIMAVCGLFMLQEATFLAASTIIVYAGAIIVTFLFVIMMAQQSGLANYDQHARQPVLAATIGAFLFAAIALCIDASYGPLVGITAESGSPKARSFVLVPGEVAAKASPLSVTADKSPTVKALGISLMTDYLWAVEIAGAVLLVTTIGAIAIANQSKGSPA